MKTLFRAFVASVLVGLLVGLPLGCVSKANAATGFTIDEYLAIPIEYAAPRVITGVDTFGPTPKAELCTRALAAMISQAQHAVTPGHVLIGTCLHISFKGPFGPHGAVVTPAFAGTPLGYILIAVMYAPDGTFVGARPLHAAGDAGTCQREAHELIDTNATNGKVPAGASLLIYCLPVPVLPSAERLPDGTQSI